jgi:hypothetical protein
MAAGRRARSRCARSGMMHWPGRRMGKRADLPRAHGQPSRPVPEEAPGEQSATSRGRSATCR